MSQATAIEWTDLSWNPVHGCSKVSPGCAHCYAETLSLRYKHTLKAWTPANAAENVLLKPHKLREPLSAAKQWQGLGAAAERAGKTDGHLVFVNSTSDLFHEQVPDGFIAEVFGVMAAAERHTFQVLTKRPERMRVLLDSEDFWETVNAFCLCHGAASPVRRSALCLPNVWLGTSIENRRFVHRADLLRETAAAVRFISAEPLLGPLVFDAHYEMPVGRMPSVVPGRRPSHGTSEESRIPAWADAPTDADELKLGGIDWLIVGGESGASHRPMREQWVRDLRDAAHASGTAFLFKQWGGSTSKAGGRELDGRTYDAFPQHEAVVA